MLGSRFSTDVRKLLLRIMRNINFRRENRMAGKHLLIAFKGDTRNCSSENQEACCWLVAKVEVSAVFRHAREEIAGQNVLHNPTNAHNAGESEFPPGKVFAERGTKNFMSQTFVVRVEISKLRLRTSLFLPLFFS